MRRSRFCQAIVALAPAALLFQPTEVWAWNGQGHRIIALVADRVLQAEDPAVAKRLGEILATDKSNEWTKTDIASEATWADALREKSPEGRAATSKWHSVRLDLDNADLKKACFGRPSLPALTPASHGPQDDCVVDKIAQFARELRDPATLPGERLMALQFLLNLVGDANDPLDAIEHNDQGGYCTAVLPPGAKTPIRLSTYWEDVLVAEAAGTDPVKAATQIAAGPAAAEGRKWSGGSPEEWAQESYSMAKTVLYNFPTGAAPSKSVLPAAKGEKYACGPVTAYRLDGAYHDRAVAAVKEQLAKAGVRLATVLQENLR